MFVVCSVSLCVYHVTDRIVSEFFPVKVSTASLRSVALPFPVSPRSLLLELVINCSFTFPVSVLHGRV